MSVEIVEDNRDQYLRAMTSAKERALEAIGLLAERFAKEELTASGAVDTGRLRASVTHMVGNDDDVYVGTNVEYGPYIELGTSRMAARPYLVPAARNHASEYRQILENELRK